MNKIAVIKFGGHSFKEEEGLKNLIKSIKFLRKMKYKVIICHGGTPSVEEKLKKENIDSKFINGFRVTTEEIMNVVKESILGNEVLEITKKISINGLPAIAINGNDALAIKCKKKSSQDTDYGFVGDIYDVNVDLLNTLINNDYIPVISPIGIDDAGNNYNINSDHLASKVAIKMSADIIIMITNVNGVYEDINDETSRIPLINNEIYQKLLDENKILPTMATKIEGLLEYVNETHNIAYIIHTNQELNYEVFQTNNYGTKIIYNNEMIRLAWKEDIENILKLIKISFPKYQKYIDYKIAPLTEEYDDVLIDILNKQVFLIYDDNTLIAHARLKIENEKARISRVCIHPNYQNKGLGSKILKHIEHYASLKGINIIGLTTLENAEYLKKFYQKNGYHTLVTNDSRGYTRAIMIKNLKPKDNLVDSYWYIQR